MEGSSGNSETAAEDALTDAERAAGLKVMHPRWGYRYKQDVDGLVQPFDFELDAVQQLRERFGLQAQDIVIATYPKCGTTWLQQIVLLLLRGSDATVAPMLDAPWLEMAASSAASGVACSTRPLSVDELCSLMPHSADSGRRVWKTHAPASLPPWRGGTAVLPTSGAKVIIVSRNSKDTAISLLHHTTSIPPFGFTGSLEEFAPLFLEGKVESSSFWEWHAGWWDVAQQNKEHVLWLRFEDLKAHLPQSVGKLARFLKLERSEEELLAVAERCGFQAMKEETSKRDKLATAEGKYVKVGHMREGRVGGWRSLMRPEMIAAFDEKTAALRARTSPDIFCDGDAEEGHHNG